MDLVGVFKNILPSQNPQDLSTRKLTCRTEQTLKMFWWEISLGLQKNFLLKEQRTEQRTALGISSKQSKNQDITGRNRFSHSTLSCPLIHIWTGKKHWMVSVRSDCRMDEDRKESKVWFASQYLERTILKSYKLAKKWEIYFCLYQKWRMREHTADNITLKLCLSLVCKVKFCEDFPQSSIKNRK